MAKLFSIVLIASILAVAFSVTGDQLKYIIGSGDSYRSETPNIQLLNEAAYFVDGALHYGEMYHSCPRQAAFIANIIQLSCQFRCLSSGDYEGLALEGRADVGNVKPGDGIRYKPRGAFKIAGRGTYKRIGQQLSVDLENHPEWAEQPTWAYKVAAALWKERNFNQLADQNNEYAFERTVVVEGLPSNMLKSVQEQVKVYYKKAKQALGCQTSPQVCLLYTSPSPRDQA
eukprot:TRINITY_DN2678_c0_g1_i4.p1 TRINITY_DN2678_c0_g1~~TRINITY_DN2678_c0_g1_i4.p1  ORF type:complete len:229 (-),score=89.59 TRINITY_DN2678_c0_g1_i4:76-762(-)